MSEPAYITRDGVVGGGTAEERAMLEAGLAAARAEIAEEDRVAAIERAHRAKRMREDYRRMFPRARGNAPGRRAFGYVHPWLVPGCDATTYDDERAGAA